KFQPTKARGFTLSPAAKAGLFKRMPQLTLDNVDIHYDVYGEGVPLVLIPGFAAGAWIWSNHVTPLSKKFQVVTFDPRGIGQSSYDSGPSRFSKAAVSSASSRIVNGRFAESARY